MDPDGGPRRPTARIVRRMTEQEPAEQPHATYAPEADGLPDPGEVVWTWVPDEDDPRQGKDRPVLVLARGSDGSLRCLQLTSKDHDRDAAQEASVGRFWMDVGSGGWDAERRPS